MLGVRPPGDNPCKGLRKKETNYKATYLSKTGYLKLGRALRALSDDHPPEVALLRFLAFTGCRRSEARTMEWDWVTEDAVNLPNSKTGPRSVWLGDAARDVLKRIERRERYVSAKEGRTIRDTQITKTWAEVRERLKKPTLRVHGLRQSFASVGVSYGEDLGAIGDLLGHGDRASTTGYAHPAECPVRAAADCVGDTIAVKSKLAQPSSMPSQNRTMTSSGATSRSAAMQTAKATSPRSEKPTETRADVRAFKKAGMSIARWCERKGIDPVELSARIKACRRENGGVL